MARKRLTKVCKGGRTKQSFLEECNINTIVARAVKTGCVNHLNTRMPHYGDYSNVPDFQTAFERVRIAEEQFASLPSNVRKRFDYDPAQFLAFVSDEKNKDEGIALGLFEKPKVPVESPKEGVK